VVLQSRACNECGSASPPHSAKITDVRPFCKPFFWILNFFLSFNRPAVAVWVLFGSASSPAAHPPSKLTLHPKHRPHDFPFTRRTHTMRAAAGPGVPCRAFDNSGHGQSGPLADWGCSR
jgi:hypothetical protein